MNHVLGDIGGQDVHGDKVGTLESEQRDKCSEPQQQRQTSALRYKQRCIISWY